MHTYNLWHNLYHNSSMWEVVIGERVFSHKPAIISLPTTTRYKLKHQYCSTFFGNLFPVVKVKIDDQAVATLGILSRMFLFYFEKISGHFGLFPVFRKIPAEIQDLAGMKFVLKKKNVLKTKTNLHFVHRKTSKGKKKWKEKKWTKLPIQ